MYTNICMSTYIDAYRYIYILNGNVIYTYSYLEHVTILVRTIGPLHGLL